MDFPTVIPFARHLGFELRRFDGGEAEIAVQLRPELLNSLDVAHGGLTMTLLDVVMAHAARSPGQAGFPQTGGVVTIEMKTSFMRPGEGELVGHGRLLHRTASMAFCEGRVLDAGGRLVAQSSGTFKYLRPSAHGPRRLTRPLREDGSD